jgi:hypothetical protein
MSRTGPDLGWRRLALGGLMVYRVPGAHDTILKEPRVTHLAATLTTVLHTAVQLEEGRLPLDAAVPEYHERFEPTGVSG